jgi:hypothetical protein
MFGGMSFIDSAVEGSDCTEMACQRSAGKVETAGDIVLHGLSPCFSPQPV